jgi:hypothetical protein
VSTVTFRNPELFEQFFTVIQIGLDVIGLHKNQDFPSREAKKIIILEDGMLKIETI